MPHNFIENILVGFRGVPPVGRKAGARVQAVGTGVGAQTAYREVGPHLPAADVRANAPSALLFR